MRLLSVWGTGTDHVDLASAAQHGVAVTNTPGVSARSIAEHALALLFAVARRLPEMDAATRLGSWPRGRSIELYGKTCGVIGYGAIGRHFARLAAAIGMRVIVWTMHPERYPGVEFVELDELYRTSDVVSLHLRLSPETTDFIAAPQFALMKPSAILDQHRPRRHRPSGSALGRAHQPPHLRRRPRRLRHRTPAATPPAHPLE